MTLEEIRNELWARRYAQQTAELISMLTDLNIAQQRIKILEEAAKSAVEVVPTKKKSIKQSLGD